MALHDIIVFLDRSAHCASRLDFAAPLAQAHGAGLIGLRVEMHPRIPQAILAGIPETALSLQRDALAADTARLKAAFAAACQAHALRCEWWQEESFDGGIDVVRRAARHANLTIIGPRPKDGDEEVASDDLLHELVLSAGRPVLVVPDPAPARPIGRRALVAWNGTREASRALADALPLLAKAEHVTVLAVLGAKDDSDPGVGEVCRHLLRNGITAEARILHVDAHDGGAALVAQARTADLLVMGAYGRSRLREVVMGGATRHVLDHLPIPVLMAH